MRLSSIKKTVYLFIIFFLLIVLTLIGGVEYYKSEQQKLKIGRQNELISIAKLKIDQISNWYTDEQVDAHVISQEFELTQEVDQWIKNPSQLNTLDLSSTLKNLTQEHNYRSVYLVSLNNEFLISSEEGHQMIDDAVIECSKNSARHQTVNSTDLYRCREHNEIHFDIVAPILNGEKEILALVVFNLDPENFLYPLIQKWPLPSTTAETILLRVDGDGVLYLNELRHQKNSALNLRVSFTEKDMPAVHAATGHSGIFEGVDYRKVKVLSYVSSVPGTPWYIVSKIDIAELNEFNKSATSLLIFLILSFIVVLILLLAYIINYIQRNTYRKLWLSREEFKTTLYSIGDAVITTDKFGRVKFLNPIAEILTGWKEKDAISQPIDKIFKIVEEETEKEIENPVQRVIRDGLIVGLANHTILISKDGARIPIADSGAPIFNEVGEIDGVVLVFRDQVEERKNRELIEESKRQLLMLMSNLQGMVYRCTNDFDWTMEFVSKGCLELTGYSDEEILYNKTKSYGDLIFPDDQIFVWETIQNAVLNKIGYQLEYRITNKNGQIIWVWEKGQGIYNERGELKALEGFITDISERKAVDEALKESEEIFNCFMEFSPIYVFFKDENIRSLRLSKNFEQMIGRPIDELIGKNMDELFPSELAKSMVADDKEILSNGKIITTEEDLNGRNYLTIKFPVVINGKPRYLAGFTMDITERKLMENALRASEQLFQTLAENSSVGIFRTNAKGLTTYVNPKWCELADCSPLEALQSGWIAKVHSDDRQGLIVGWEKALAVKERSQAEYRFVHSDGEVRWVKGEAVPELNDNGELSGYIGTITDITERMQNEEKLLTSNNLLRTIIDNIPDAVYMKDLEGRKLIANKADLENIGAENESDVLNKNDFDLFPKEIAAEFWADDQKVLKSGNPIINREEKLINNQKKLKWLWTSKIPFKNTEGNIIGLVGIGHDVTRRKQDQKEMMKLSTAITQSPVSIVITDLNSNIEYVNPKFTEITGYTFDEVKGKNPRILKSGTQSSEFYTNMWKDLTNGSSWTSEIQNKKKNGELYWENAIISPIKNEKGEIINYVAVKEDITQRKKMLQELILAKDKAEESDRLKTSFLANMSHEIRTPLNSILGFTSFITSDDTLTNQEKNEFADIINKSADGLLQIINDIIDISSLETGQLKMFCQRFNPQQTIESVNKIHLKRLADLNKPKLEVKMLPFTGNAEIETDENRLMQIFNNLIGNAMKFTDEGYIEFGIEKVETGFVHFKVEDTGRGIANDMQAIVFERFRQGEDSITRNFGGNGLGLSIVKNLIGLMGGKISLESEMGKGSTFRFTIPVSL